MINLNRVLAELEMHVNNKRRPSHPVTIRLDELQQLVEGYATMAEALQRIVDFDLHAGKVCGFCVSRVGLADRLIETARNAIAAKGGE